MSHTVKEVWKYAVLQSQGINREDQGVGGVGTQVLWEKEWEGVKMMEDEDECVSCCDFMSIQSPQWPTSAEELRTLSWLSVNGSIPRCHMDTEETETRDKAEAVLSFKAESFQDVALVLRSY